jgi:carbon-monoxide dehydrogenase small subunit
MIPINMIVNGKAVSAMAEGRTLLVHFVREQLGLKGTHVGCDTSQCGCCVMHVDGEAVKSCTMLALEAEGTDVVTIEGLASPDGTMSVVQQAFKDHYALQCGFCTPGMVMNATAFLRQNPAPDDQEIVEALEGNLCRCTGYRNIVAAIRAASDALADGAAI